MLHEFVNSNRDELIRRCRSKVRRRDSPPANSSELEHGVPLFLDQLVDSLRCEQANAARKYDGRHDFRDTTASVENGRTAALHGKELCEKGYTVEQVVHDYGDVCQAVTELATETGAQITVTEFHTLNRLLDNAIAHAVSSHDQNRGPSTGAHGDERLHERMGTLADEQRRLLDTALKALDALKVGNVGLMGATGTVLEDTLLKLRGLVDKSLPEIRLATGMTAAPAPSLRVKSVAGGGSHG